MTKVSLLLITIAALFASGCREKVTYPIEPILSNPTFALNRVAASDTTPANYKVVLTCTFTDGDGDIGLTKVDTTPPNNYNFFIDYFEKIDGVFTKITTSQSLTDTVNFNSRIPILNSDGATKSISGTINIELDVTRSPSSESDTILFKYYIKDRALNKSNILSCGPIGVPRE